MSKPLRTPLIDNSSSSKGGKKKKDIDESGSQELTSFLDDDSAGDGKRLLSVDDELEEQFGVVDEADDEFEAESNLIVFNVEKHAKLVVSILKPVSLCMILVVWMVRLIHTVQVNVR